MEASIYDVLVGHFVEGEPLPGVNEDRHRYLSVMSNLNRLFNTRQGSIAHLPEYGLPDISSVYRDAPRSIDGLRRAIKEAIQRYEPRLQRVRVEHEETDQYAMRLIFILKAELTNGERVRFQTTFESHESAQVRSLKRPAY